MLINPIKKLFFSDRFGSSHEFCLEFDHYRIQELQRGCRRITEVGVLNLQQQCFDLGFLYFPSNALEFYGKR